MKKLLIFALLFSIAQVACAQMDGSYNHSIGIKVFGIQQVPKIKNDSQKENYISTYLNAVTLKFNDNQISYRLSGSYYKDDIDVLESDNGSGEITDYAVKMGFEKNFNYGTVQPYFLMDLGYRSHEFDGLLGASTLTNVSKQGFTLSPGFGIKVNVAKMLTLFAEGNIEFFYFQNKLETSETGATNRNTFKNYQSQFLLNPVSTGIQVHFGNKR
jgi:hypothetical protein